MIEPESRVSTYALLDAVDRGKTFGSTVGIEATFWGKISILAGHSLYEHLDVAYAAKSHGDLLELLGATLDAKPRLDAIKYGFCMSTFGVPFVYWQPNGFLDGRFRGKSLKWTSDGYLERRIVTKCLDTGLHTPLVHDLVCGVFKVISVARHGGSLASKFCD